MTPRALALALFLLFLPLPIAHAQKVESKDRDRGQIMLDRIKDELKKPNSPVREIDILAKQKQGQQVTDLTDYNVYIDMVRKSQRDDRVGRDRYMSLPRAVLTVSR